jgi:hypothetical protein
MANPAGRELLIYHHNARMKKALCSCCRMLLRFGVLQEGYILFGCIGKIQRIDHMLFKKEPSSSFVFIFVDLPCFISSNALWIFTKNASRLIGMPSSDTATIL